MNRLFLMLAVVLTTQFSIAQDSVETNETRISTPECSGVETNEHRPWQDKRRSSRHSKRHRTDTYPRLQLMERELDRIGVTEEEKAQITLLQNAHKEKMAENAMRIKEARDELTALLDQGASMEELESAIEKVSAAQTEQLRILVMNRIEMERILGKKKHDEFMKNARLQYKKHGRRGGPPLPPRPGFPPDPGQPEAPSLPPETPPTPPLN